MKKNLRILRNGVVSLLAASLLLTQTAPVYALRPAGAEESKVRQELRAALIPSHTTSNDTLVGMEESKKKKVEEYAAALQELLDGPDIAAEAGAAGKDAELVQPTPATLATAVDAKALATERPPDKDAPLDEWRTFLELRLISRGDPNDKWLNHRCFVQHRLAFYLRKWDSAYYNKKIIEFLMRNRNVRLDERKARALISQARYDITPEKPFVEPEDVEILIAEVEYFIEKYGADDEKAAEKILKRVDLQERLSSQYGQALQAIVQVVRDAHRDNGKSFDRKGLRDDIWRHFSGKETDGPATAIGATVAKKQYVVEPTTVQPGETGYPEVDAQIESILADVSVLLAGQYLEQLEKRNILRLTNDTDEGSGLLKRKFVEEIPARLESREWKLINGVGVYLTWGGKHRVDDLLKSGGPSLSPEAKAFLVWAGQLFENLNRKIEVLTVTIRKEDVKLTARPVEHLLVVEPSAAVRKHLESQAGTLFPGVTLHFVEKVGDVSEKLEEKPPIDAAIVSLHDKQEAVAAVESIQSAGIPVAAMHPASFEDDFLLKLSELRKAGKLTAFVRKTGMAKEILAQFGFLLDELNNALVTAGAEEIQEIGVEAAVDLFLADEKTGQITMSDHRHGTQTVPIKVLNRDAWVETIAGLFGTPRDGTQFQEPFLYKFPEKASLTAISDFLIREGAVDRPGAATVGIQKQGDHYVLWRVPKMVLGLEGLVRNSKRDHTAIIWRWDEENAADAQRDGRPQEAIWIQLLEIDGNRTRVAISVPQTVLVRSLTDWDRIRESVGEAGGFASPGGKQIIRGLPQEQAQVGSWNIIKLPREEELVFFDRSPDPSWWQTVAQVGFSSRGTRGANKAKVKVIALGGTLIDRQNVVIKKMGEHDGPVFDFPTAHSAVAVVGAGAEEKEATRKTRDRQTEEPISISLTIAGEMWPLGDQSSFERLILPQGDWGRRRLAERLNLEADGELLLIRRELMGVAATALTADRFFAITDGEGVVLLNYPVADNSSSLWEQFVDQARWEGRDDYTDVAIVFASDLGIFIKIQDDTMMTDNENRFIVDIRSVGQEESFVAMLADGEPETGSDLFVSELPESERGQTPFRNTSASVVHMGMVWISLSGLVPGSLHRSRGWIACFVLVSVAWNRLCA